MPTQTPTPPTHLAYTPEQIREIDSLISELPYRHKGIIEAVAAVLNAHVPVSITPPEPQPEATEAA